MIGIGFILAFAGGSALLYLSKSEHRTMIFGCAMAVTFIAWAIAILTGLGPNSYN